MSKLIVNIFLVLTLFLMQAEAAEYRGTVKGFYLNSSNLGLIRLSEGNASPQCGANDGWHFSYDASKEHSKQWTSMILAAKMANREIIVGYTPTTSGYCDAIYVYIWD